MSINRVVISGNLTRDPDIRSTSSGMTVMSLGVAVNDRRRNSQTGEWEDSPNFVDCTMFGTRAERLSSYLSKGTKVAIEGKLRWHQWETKDGAKRSKLDVIIDDLEFMSSRNSYSEGNNGDYGQSRSGDYGFSGYGNAASAEKSAATSAYAPQNPAMDASPSVYDEEIPF